MKNIDQAKYPKVVFGNNVIIKADSIIIKEGVRIGNDVQIEAKTVIIGYDSIIESGTLTKGLGCEMEKFILGDNCFIGFNNQILVPYFTMLDFSQIHNSCLINGYKRISIGNNCWIGQQSILNSTEELTICNNVRIGTQSQLWTHVASGELLEGCTLFGKKPLVLEDNVWIVGGAVISPGLILKHNSIIMTGSVLTKNTEAYNTYAGVPAKNVTDKLNFWVKPDITQKAEKLKTFIIEFTNEMTEYHGKIHFFNKINEAANYLDLENQLIFIKEMQEFSKYLDAKATIFDLATKMYIKKRSKIEIDWMRFSIGYRARFIPFVEKQEK